jgi:hypothetical protein
LIDRQGAKSARKNNNETSNRRGAKAQRDAKENKSKTKSDVLCGFSLRLCGYRFSLRFLCDHCASAVKLFLI